MTKPGYASLSLRMGVLCGRADEYLGYDYFGPKARAKRWEFTEALLAQWHQEALALGVPESVIAFSEADVKMADLFLEDETTRSTTRR